MQCFIIAIIVSFVQIIVKSIGNLKYWILCLQFRCIDVQGLGWRNCSKSTTTNGVIDIDMSTKIWPHLMWNIGENETGYIKWLTFWYLTFHNNQLMCLWWILFILLSFHFVNASLTQQKAFFNHNFKWFLNYERFALSIWSYLFRSSEHKNWFY